MAIIISLVMLVVHPSHDFALLGGLVNQQNQQAKTGLFLVAFAVVLPLALTFVPRLADVVASGANQSGLGALAGLLAASLASTIIIVRLSGDLPWGSGLAALLGGTAGWGVIAVAVLGRAARRKAWPPLLRVAKASFSATVVAGMLVLGTLLCVTNLGLLGAPGLVLGTVLALATLAAFASRERRALPRLTGPVGLALDLALIVIVLLAIPNVVIFHASSVPPSPFFEPGLVQSQHDFFLGPTNQLLAGGALLVNAPGSQYGVGSLYFLAAWFHLVPIGYGTFGLLDGMLTALFYLAGYILLRVSGVTRAWAGAIVAVGVVTLVYHFQFVVGVLPELGPLRFGLPMLVVLGEVTAARWPHRRRLARTTAFLALGVSAIWAAETFGFTLVTWAAATAIEAWLLPADRRRWLIRQAMFALAACVGAHLLFALATLAGSGQLPDWGQYFAYVHSFLLGGKAGQVTYGFARWSPALALGAATLASAAAIVLLARRAPSVAKREHVAMIALTGSTAYAIALFSYIDSRSSTYLLPYVAFPTLLTGALWLLVLLRSIPEASRRIGLWSLTFALSIPVLLLGAAWPGIGARFSGSVLSHAYPGGGLTAAIDRLVHPPAIDPRTPVGERLLERYVPGRRAVVLIAAAPDLGTEILMHSRRANGLAIGDQGMDSYVPSNWTGIIGSQIARLHPGSLVLADTAALAVNEKLRADPSIDPLNHPLTLGGNQLEWILQRLDQRFRLTPILRDRHGFVIARLKAR